MAITLRIYALGPFQVAHDATFIPDAAWKTQKNKALLKILITYRGHTLAKDRLLEWLWPERHPDTAGRDLRVAISHLRALLQPDLPHGSQSAYILTTEAGYAWNTSADYRLDAQEFEQLASALLHPTHSPPSPQIIARMEYALSIYRGDYLEDDRYAEWPVSHRERLREMHIGLLTTLAEAYARQGRYSRAVSLCRHVLSEDNCHENIWHRLMLYHYHAGDQAQALRAYEQCRQALAKELGIEPLPETATLARQIRERTLTRLPEYPRPRNPQSSPASQEHGIPHSMKRTPLVGRDAEYATLLEHIALARNRQGRVVLIEGEAGIGKSRLAEELLGYARQQGITVLGGSCREKANEPYRPIIEAMHYAFNTRRQHFDNLPPAWLAALSNLLPELRQAYPNLPTDQPIPPGQERTNLFYALAHTLLAMPGDGGLLCLALDDLHWADTSTLDFLEYFASYVESSPTLLLCVLRSEEARKPEIDDPTGDWLWSIRRRGILHRVTLQPLPAEDVALLVEKLFGLGEQSKALADRLYAETDGNPLFLLSVLQSLFDDGFLLVGSNGGWVADLAALPAPGASSLPPTMQQVILHRLRQLDTGERETLEAAAVLGRRFEWSILHGMRAWRRDVLFDNLDRLKEAMLVRRHGPDTYSFSHDKVRQAVYDHTSPSVRAWLHGKAGESLAAHYAERPGEAASAIAMHFEQAGRPDQAFIYHMSAGAYATRIYANSEAISHYQCALALVEQGGFRPSPGALCETHLQLGNLYQVAGQYGAAATHLLAALERSTTPIERAALLHKLAHNHDRQGRRDDAILFLRQAVDEIDTLSNQPEHTGPQLEAAKIYARWSILDSSEHGAERSRHYALRAVAMLGDHLTGALHGSGLLSWAEYDSVHSVLTNAGEAFRLWGYWSDARLLFEQALAVSERQREPVGIGYSCHNLGDVLLAEAKFEAARAAYSRSADAFRQTHQTWEEMASLMHLGLAWACEGHWNEAAICLERACDVGENMEPTEWLADTYLWRCIVEIYKGGSYEQGIAYRERATAVARATGQPLPPDTALLSRALVEWRSESSENDTDRPQPQHLEPSASLLFGNRGRAFYIGWIMQQLYSTKNQHPDAIL